VARLFLALAAFCGFLAVAFGAFGAHALRGSLSNYSLSVFETAVHYHFFHALALLGVGLLARGSKAPARWLRISGAAFAVGILVFCGSLYLLALTGERWLGAVTPLGGISFLLGWGSLAVSVLKTADGDE
jgi:uncharacterized membrane protein YgdD (TMEM256/DUF423 family)